MTKITITEALAELNTIQKRIEKKRESTGNYMARSAGMKDPLEKQGGSVTFVKNERQAVQDLSQRHLQIRMAIQKANQAVTVTVQGQTRTVAEWLTWRKEHAPADQKYLATVRQGIDKLRQQATARGQQLVSAGAAEIKPTDIEVNIDEKALAEEIEQLENVLGTLDGKLSLINAITTIEV